MAKLMDIFDGEQREAPDRDVAGVEFTVDELSVLVAGFQGPFWELFSRILAKMKEQDIDCTYGTMDAKDIVDFSMAKGSFLALTDIGNVPAIAIQVLKDLQNAG